EAQRHERVVRAPVLLRQLAPARPRRLARGRYVRVLGEEQRLEAGVLGRAGELGRVDRRVGGEGDEAEVHQAATGTAPMRCGVTRRCRRPNASAKRYATRLEMQLRPSGEPSCVT